MNTFSRQQSSRNVGAIGGFILALFFAPICFWLFAKTSVGILGLVLGIFSTSVALYFAYFLFRPVSWILEISPDTLYWRSPHFPNQLREIPLRDIQKAFVIPGETKTIQIDLFSGESVTLPCTCVGRDGSQIVDFLMKTHPRNAEQDAAANP